MKKLHNFNEVFDSQAVFRILLDATANPTRSLSITEYADRLYGESTAMLALAMTLLDNEVSFAAPDNDELAEQIVLLTHSGKTELNDADYIFISDKSNVKAAVEAAKYGTLADPQKSATLIISDDGAGEHEIFFEGPGIDGAVHITVSDTVKATVDARDAQHYEYPQGIDLIFISERKTLFCIPRTTRRENK